MKITTTLLALTLMNSSFAFDKTYIRDVDHAIPGAREMKFGLSKLQKQQILELTHNQIDLRNIFVVKNNGYKSLSGEIGEPHNGGHLPPFFVTEYDPKTKEGWWQQSHKVSEAWKIATGKGVTIADCDAGFYIDEEDIAGNLLMNFARDFSDKDDPTTVNDGGFVSHGTSVAAIMVGILNGKGINGMAPDAKLIPFQNYNYAANDKVDKEEATAACILHALTIPEVKVIVLENQTHGSSETFMGTREAVRLALKAGVTIVSAGGNSSNELTAEAADDTGSIIVGAVNKDNETEYFSNYGSRVSVAAYGSNLLTLSGPDGSMGMFGGTSGATPQVASAVALMLEANPELTPAQIKDILIKTRITTPKNKNVGGLLNLVGALKNAKTAKSLKNNHSEFREKLIAILTDAPTQN